MFIEERQKDIVKRVNETGRILVSEIQDIYQVSADCARRDLRQLEGKGLLKRTYGGAMALTSIGVYPEKMYNPKDLEEFKRTTMPLPGKHWSLSNRMRYFILQHH